MPAKTRLPTPLSASLGLVVTAVEEARLAVRHAPQRAVQLPFQLIAGAVLWNERFRARYDELAERGEVVVARLRSRGSVVGERFAHDAVEGLADVRELVRPGGETAGAAATVVTDGVRDLAERSAEEVWDDSHALLGGAGSAFDRLEQEAEATPDGQLDELAPTAPGAPPAEAATETPDDAETAELWAPEPAADPVAEAAEAEAAEAEAQPLRPTRAPDEQAQPDMPVPGHDGLPLPDFDHMTLGSLRGRLRRLDLASLEQLRAYEQAHARRLPILTMLENRIAKISEQGGGAPQPGAADDPAGAAGEVATGAADDPQADAPAPGVPADPAQPWD